jgi:hypothetical protein
MEALSTKTDVVPHAKATFPPLGSWFSGRTNARDHSLCSTSLVHLYIEGVGQKAYRDVPFELEKRHYNFEIQRIFLLNLSKEKNGNYCVYEEFSVI